LQVISNGHLLLFLGDQRSGYSRRSR